MISKFLDCYLNEMVEKLNKAADELIEGAVLVYSVDEFLNEFDENNFFILINNRKDADELYSKTLNAMIELESTPYKFDFNEKSEFDDYRKQYTDMMKQRMTPKTILPLYSMIKMIIDKIKLV